MFEHLTNPNLRRMVVRMAIPNLKQKIFSSNTNPHWNRARAKALGEKSYFTGKPCSKGHVSLRTTTTGQCKECRKIFYEENKESAFIQAKEWGKRNPDKLRSIRRNTTRKRKARLVNAEGSHTQKQILELLKKQRYKCMNCGLSVKDSYHVDHIMPLKKGGSNYIKNIQILCPSCNVHKQAKDPIKWAQENGRLL